MCAQCFSAAQFSVAELFMLLCFVCVYIVFYCRTVRCCHAVSVCVFVTFVSCVKMNKDIFEIFSPSGSHTILVFQ